MSIIVLNNYITQAAGLKSGLIAYWALDEASGTRADSHTNGFDLTDNNTVASATGLSYSNAADFEEANSEYLSYDTDDDLLSPSSFSICFSCKAESLPSLNTIRALVSKNDNDTTSNSEYMVSLSNVSGAGVDFNMYLHYGASYTELRASTFGAPSTGTWYFIHAYHDQGTEIGISVNNGTADTASLNQTMNNGSGRFNIGARMISDSPFQEWDGLIGPVAMWNRVLTADEVTQFYNSGTPLTYAAL